MYSKPRVVGIAGDTPDLTVLAEAARVIREGGLVAFPTETVYGLAADATNPKAVDRLNNVKGRPPEKPYSLHIHSINQVAAYVPVVPPLARRLMECFWPGPLTIVMPGNNGATVGFRLPDHPVAFAFLEACGVPIVAPSANRSGSPPPTDAAEVVAALGGEIDYILDAGPTRLGKESTVVEIIDGRVTVRREGAIAREAILSAVNSG